MVLSARRNRGTNFIDCLERFAQDPETEGETTGAVGAVGALGEDRCLIST